jgi:hypothetical protein
MKISWNFICSESQIQKTFLKIWNNYTESENVLTFDRIYEEVLKRYYTILQLENEFISFPRKV